MTEILENPLDIMFDKRRPAYLANVG